VNKAAGTQATVCACGGARYRRVLRADRYCTYGVNTEPLEYSLIRCLACGLVRTSPAPEDHDHSSYRDDAFVETYLAREELFQRLLRSTMDDITLLAPPPRRFVDVGANIGTIVSMATALGYDATGVEPNEAAAEVGRARGLQMISAPLVSAGFSDESLDIVCLSATAEHVAELDQSLALCRRLLRPGGMLFVANSPNYRSFGARYERALWYGIQPTGHVWQFSPATLRAVFARAGFRVVFERTFNLHRDFGRNRKERLRKAAFGLAAATGLGDALSMAGVRP